MNDHRTKQQLLEELTELRRLEVQWRSAIATTPAFIAIVDRNSAIQFLNHLQPGLSVEEAIGKTVYTYIHPKYHDIVREHLQHVFQTGESRYFEAIGAGPNGQEAWYDTYLGPVKMADQVVAVSITAIDITERKQAEEALRESEERYRRLAESTTDMIYIMDRAGTIRYANTSAVMAIGFDMQSIVGMRQEELFSPEMAQQHKASITKVFETGEVSKEDGVYHFGPEQIWLNTCLIPLRDEKGQISSVMGVSRNITDRKHVEQALKKAHDELEQRVEERTAELAATNERLRIEIEERKQAEMALRQSHDELKSIYDQVADGIIIVDAEKVRAIHVNPAYCRMVGYSSEEMKTISPKQVHPPEVYPKVLSHFETLKQGNISMLENLPFLRKDGSVVYVDVTASPIRYNERRCWIAFFHDVTERKKAEELLRREHRTLKHLLQSSDHDRQLIAYEIHDELAQQLAGAIMHFQAFQHQKETRPKDAAKDFNTAMTMLQKGHFESRRLIAGVRPPILDENGVVEAIAHLVHEQNRLKGPKIEYHSSVSFDRLAPTVENSIYRIAQEGLMNAFQHSKSEKARISLVQQEDRVRIEIRDWGIGFDTKSVLEDCFGLIGIRHRARLLGGKCSIQSKTGKGTRIVVELPVVERK